MSITLTSTQQSEITAYINAYRAKHQAPPLIWDNTIAGVSNQWSNYLLTNKLFEHSNNSSYGENLAYFQGYGTDVMTLLKNSVDSWYNEVVYYNFNTPAFSTTTGHFTCLVWKSSTKYAIGISIDNVSSAADIVMNTSPPGNVMGQFEQNVLPIASVPVPGPSPVPGPGPIQIDKNEIANELYNIITMIQAGAPKKAIANYIINVVIEINSAKQLSIKDKSDILKMLYGVLGQVRSRMNIPPLNIVTNINAIISKLISLL